MHLSPDQYPRLTSCSFYLFARTRDTQDVKSSRRIWRSSSVPWPWWYLTGRSSSAWNSPAAVSKETSSWLVNFSPSTSFVRNSWPNRLEEKLRDYFPLIFLCQKRKAGTATLLLYFCVIINFFHRTIKMVRRLHHEASVVGCNQVYNTSTWATHLCHHLVDEKSLTWHESMLVKFLHLCYRFIMTLVFVISCLCCVPWVPSREPIRRTVRTLSSWECWGTWTYQNW